MESLYILIPIAIVLVCIAVAIFLWAVKSEQFEDLERQGHSILFDEEAPKKKEESKNLEEVGSNQPGVGSRNDS